MYWKQLIPVVVLVIGLASCKPHTTNTGSTISQNDIVVLSAEDNKAIIEKEISAWEFAKNKDFARLKQIYADDYLAYFGKNKLNASESIQSFQNAQINAYRLSNIHVKPVTNEVVVIYYDLAQDIVGSDGAKWLPNVQSSTVYAKRAGQWRAVFYHEAMAAQ